jgi:mono/diheme cytochrome c family protein
MKNHRPYLFFAALTIILSMMLAAHAERKPLRVQAPASYASKMNPFRDDADAHETGRRIYWARCAKCHEVNHSGIRKGAQLDIPEIVQAPPGSLFWVIEKGDSQRGMPSFAQLPPDYRWKVITYLQQRTGPSPPK